MAKSEAVQKVLDHLQNVKQTASGWEACCPAHEDQHASLSIGAGESGCVLLHCHAGCSAKAIMTAIGFKLQDLFPPRDGGMKYTRPAAPKPPTSPKGRLEPPRNMEREAAFSSACRDNLRTDQDALAFLWRRRGIGGRTASDWGVGVTDIRRDSAGVIVGVTWTLPIFSHVPPHPLIGVKLHRDPPRPGQSKGRWLVRGGVALFPLLEAQQLQPGAEIVLCEGELKALAYIEVGLAATSPTTGAATGWTPDMAARFADLAVVIDPDREDSEATRDFVSNAAHALWRVAHSVEVCGLQREREVTA